MEKGISVIVCCYNAATRIKTTLSYLFQQKNHLPWEIIIVDNASNDETSQTVQQIFQTSNVTMPLTLIMEKQQGLTYARLAGAKRAKHDILLYCDDDNWLCDTYIQTAWETINRDPHIVAVGGKGDAISDVSLPWWFEELSNVYACSAQKNNQPLYGAGLVIRKAPFLEFYQREKLMSGRQGASLLSGEDTQLSIYLLRHKWSLVYNEQLNFKHYMPPNRLTVPYLKKLFYALGKSHYLLAKTRYCSYFLHYRLASITHLFLGIGKDIVYGLSFKRAKLLRLYLKFFYAAGFFALLFFGKKR